MNSSKLKKKRARKILHVRYRQASSTNKSCSHIGITAGYKKRISSLLRNNKILASALQDSRQELSNVKSCLESRNESLHSMMFFHNKMIVMHSALKSFTKDFDEALQLIKWDDTKWATLDHVIRSHNNIRNKMVSDMNPVEETSEISSEPEVSNLSMGATRSSDNFICDSVASDIHKVVVQSEQKKKTRDSVDQISTEETLVSYDQQDSTPEICMKFAVPRCSDVSKTPVFPELSFRESDEAVHQNETEISKTPEHCISTESVPNINSAAIKSENSKIPRFNFSANIKKKKQLFSMANEEKIISAVKTGILNSDFCQALASTGSSEIPTEASCSFDNCSNHEAVLTLPDLNILDVINHHNRKTFVIKQMDKTSDNVVNSQAQNNRRKTFVKKTCNADRKIIISENKRETFTVTKNDEAEKFVSDSEDCDMVDDVAFSNNAIENVTKLHNKNTEISSDLNEVSMLNTGVIVKGVINTPILSNTEDPLVNSCDKNKKSDSTLHLAQRHEVLTISAQESQEDSWQKTNDSDINHNKDASAQDNELKSINSPDDTNVISHQYMCVEFDTSSEKEEEEKNILNAAEVNLVDNIANSIKHDGNEEIDQDDDLKILKELKPGRKSSAPKMRKRVSYAPFFSSSESDDEEINNIDSYFQEDIPIKDPPIRGHISESKPPKIFVFDANKRKSSFLRDRLKKLNPVKKSVKLYDSEIPNKSNDGILGNINKQNIENFAVNIKEGHGSKKYIKFSGETSVKMKDACDMVDNSCEKNPDKSLKTLELSHTSNEEQNAEGIVSSESMAVDKHEIEVCTSSDTVASAIDQISVFPTHANMSIGGQNECTINSNHVKSTVCDAAIETDCMSIKNESKEKKVKSLKRKLPDDKILVEDFVSEKKSKEINSKIVVKVDNSEEIIGTEYAKKGIKNKKKNVKKKKTKQVTSCKNTFLVHAEIHSPPSYINLSPCNSPQKENREFSEIKNSKLSVVLSDILQTDTVDKLMISFDKELLFSKKKTHPPAKTPLSDNSSNVQSTAVTTETTKATSNSNCSEEIKTARRRRAPVSYKEGSAKTKMRR